MREIKFRAFDELNKEMRYSDKHDGEFYMNLKGLLYMYGIPKTDNYYKNYNVMQFTGLKDKNGIDIYEGDIVNSNYFKNGIVVFWRYGWHFNTGKDCHHSFNTSTHSFEIIGNIYEHPNLLNNG